MNQEKIGDTPVLELNRISKEFIKQYLPDNPTIIEAGAHIGRDTVKMSKLWPNSKIYAFEPVPELFQYLINNTKNYSNIFCFQLALSNKIELADLYVSSGRSTALSSLLKPEDILQIHPDAHFEKISVQTTTLDKWAEEHQVKSVDFMWLDLQGAELHALEGANNLLKTVKVILIEASLTNRYSNNPTYNTLKNYIEQKGFKAVAQSKEKYGKVDLLFIKN